MTPVGENLAQSYSIVEAHERLMRSAVHRNNILDPNWERVGIGIVKNEQGQYIIVEEFSLRSLSKDPLTKSQEQKLEQEIIRSINKARAKQGLKKLNENYRFSRISKEALAISLGDTEKTLSRISKSPYFKTLKRRITSLSTETYFMDLAKTFSEHPSIMEQDLKQIAIAIWPNYKTDQLGIIILLQR